MQELVLGAVSISVLLSIVLRLVYNTVNISNKLKPWLAILIGIVLGILTLFYNGEQVTFVSIVNYIINGFMTGATAVGIYEITKKQTAKVV